MHMDAIFTDGIFPNSKIMYVDKLTNMRARACINQLRHSGGPITQCGTLIQQLRNSHDIIVHVHLRMMLTK